MLGYSGRCADDDLQLADKLQSIGGDVADLLGYQRLCERHALPLEHPPDHHWWPRRERGRTSGILGIFVGLAMLIKWLITGWVA
jgi:hypothetical protein